MGSLNKANRYAALMEDDDETETGNETGFKNKVKAKGAWTV